MKSNPVLPACALALAGLPLAAAAGSVGAERGAYLARIMDCAGCHMPMGPDGAPDAAAGLSGGTFGFEVPGFGIVWPPNLTPDETGLGSWSDAEIAAALTTGVRPDGRELAPVMPWRGYAGMEPDDLGALIAFLRAQPPVPGQVPPPAASGEDAAAPYFTVAMPQ
ncbi:c-type cytochrome [Mangrovicoccus sp. HB161399]|uniref:c-type cytochrome n=1 Tax=Mangrovicoccus sp. HB161399 TaxID=2720392 RepID=UPI0015540A48|nr:c-type cytochrome [Mangrovicoccus sp. HB161399]